jgi:uncharacterized membrane protein
MLAVFMSIVPQGLELVFCLMMVVIYFGQTTGKRYHFALINGAVLGACSAVMLYLIQTFVTKLEIMDLIEKVFLVFVLICFFLWISLLWKQNKINAAKPFSFTLGFVITLDSIKAILPLFIPSISLADGFSSEWVIKLTGAVFAVVLLALLSLCILHTASLMKRKHILGFLIVSYVDVFAKALIESLQLLFGLQMIPLNMWELDLLAPFVDHKGLFLDGFAGFILLFFLLLLASISKYLKEKSVESRNPAEQRLYLSGKRSVRRWFVGLVAVLTIVFTTVALNTINAEQSLGTPPVAVSAQNGNIVIDGSQMDGGKLNTYSFKLQDGTTVRFLVIRKQAENFGVGLDACQNCGAAGYYQDGDQIICKKCGSAINATSIGFKGGCNPIPLAFQNAGNGSIVIPVSELQKAEGIFQ